MQDPLKQGLKQHYLNNVNIYFEIRMQDPLKQGLKHFTNFSSCSPSNDSNARSIKTRIETIL